MTATADRVTKKKLTVAEAAEQFERCTLQMKQLAPQVEEAKAVLVEHFEKTGRSTYKDRIVYGSWSRTILDQSKVREFLGAQLKDFQTRISGRSVQLVGD